MIPIRRRHSPHRGLLDQSLCGQAALRVGETTMEPDLPEGRVVGVAFGRLFLPGEVVVFRNASSGSVQARRLLGYRRLQGRWVAVAAGDGPRTVDRSVPLSEVIGRVSYADLTITVMDRLRALGAFGRTLGRVVVEKLGRRP